MSGNYTIEVSGNDGKRETLLQRFELSVGSPIKVASFSAFTFTPSDGLSQAEATKNAVVGEFKAQGDNSPFSFTLTDGAGDNDNQYFMVDGSKLRVSGNDGEKFVREPPINISVVSAGHLRAGTYSIHAIVTDAKNNVFAKDFSFIIE